MTASASAVIICATARLARNVQLQLNHDYIANGLQQWQAPAVYTLAQWLQKMSDFIWLAAEVPADHFSSQVLAPFAETILWQQAIQSHLAKHAYAALFDVPSLAKTAAAANQLLISWQIDDAQLQRHAVSAETKQFCQWRQRFLALCKQHQTVSPAQQMAQQIQAIAASDYPFPKQMTWLGFDRMTPQEQDLLTVLRAKKIQINLTGVQVNNPQLAQIGLSDLQTECRAAAAWARTQLAQNPACQLAIISPVQAQVRRLLSDLLDDTFHPQTREPSQYEATRSYDFSVGIALSEHPMCRTALLLLRFTQTGKALTQADLSALLLDIYWGSPSEIDLRAQVDARMRKKLMRTINLNQVIDLIKKNPAASQLMADLQTIASHHHAWAKKQLPSAWAQHFTALLEALNWAKTRALSSYEFQAKKDWQKVLLQLVTLDTLTGTVSAGEAIGQLNAIATNTMFMPEASDDVHIQLLGMLENLAKPVDAIWVMGMNDHRWPPPTNLNPLLPISLARQLKLPGADAQTQSAFAQTVHERLCHSAKSVIFSWSQKDGERQLRPSPLLRKILPLTTLPEIGKTLSETLAKPLPLERLDDNLAPPIMTDEKVRGGSHLLQAQAICPAWAFYQHRLGAQALEEPDDGLNSMMRGNLVHAALHVFWLACRDAATLKNLTDNALNLHITQSIADAFIDLKLHLPAALVRLEEKRIHQLLSNWLLLEKMRESFTVKACEEKHLINIAGLSIECRIDRIDALDDASLVIIDYKTGAASPSVGSWAPDKIKEPQLPLYAAIALKGEAIAAVCFAKVHIDECQFIGLAQTAILPNVKPLDQLTASSTFNGFVSMDAIIMRWHDALEKVAEALQQGEAGVIFADENDLLYCPVKPLLRLAERQLQFEIGQASDATKDQTP